MSCSGVSHDLCNRVCAQVPRRDWHRRRPLILKMHVWVLRINCSLSCSTLIGFSFCHIRCFYVGKTTLLRDITRQLADIFHKVVMVVDTSDEIAGGGRMAHECIGRARRMGGTAHQSKYEVLEEAVANHGPEVGCDGIRDTSKCSGCSAFE